MFLCFLLLLPKRHNLGKYADEAKMFESFIAPLQEDEEEGYDEEELELEQKHLYGNGEDGDIKRDKIIKEEEDWVIRALKTYKGSEQVERDEESDNEDDWGIMNINLNLGKKKKPLTVLEAARASQINLNTRKNYRKEINVANESSTGSSGVLGRLRAVSGSRILGAYPGDAVPIEDAANAKGVTDLARKYGYGDWSDDDNDENIWSNGRGAQKKRRQKRPGSPGTQQNRTRRKRKSKFSPSFESGMGSDGLTIGFEFGSPQKRTVKRKRRTRRNRMKMDNIKTVTNTNLSPRRRPILSDSQKDVRVRKPMERTILQDKSKDAARRRMRNVEGITQRRFDSRSRVRSPLQRTKEWTAKNESEEK